MNGLALSAAAVWATAMLLSGPICAADEIGRTPSGEDRPMLAQAAADEQRIRRLLNPPLPGSGALPGDARTRRLREPAPPPDPAARWERERRRLLQDPAARLGLPPNPSLMAPPAPETATAPVTLPPEIERLDRDRDGAISRSEYFRGRDRLVPAGPAGDVRQRQLLDRLDSRFREADRNRDGAVTPQELGEYGSPRF